MMRPFQAKSIGGLAALWLLTACDVIYGGSSNHRYKQGEQVDLWVNTVGPYSNPQESYEYYSLPYCAPHTKQNTTTSRFMGRKSQTIGEYLGGNALRHSGHDILFNSDSSKSNCETAPLTDDEAQQFATAIRNRWFYQMYVDDLPVWGMVGEMMHWNGLGQQDYEAMVGRNNASTVQNLNLYVYTARSLIISYNGDQIVKVDLVSDWKSWQEVKPGVKLNFELRVQWESTTEAFSRRFLRYLDHEFFHHPFHWLSIINPVLLPMAYFIAWLLWNLKKDFARYSLVPDSEAASGNDANDGGTTTDARRTNGNNGSGWKQVHGDVFRAPSHLFIFSALTGSGWQLVGVTLGSLVYAVAGNSFLGGLHEKRGALISAGLIWYILSSGVAGFQSGRFWSLYLATTAEGRLQAASPTSLWQVPTTTMTAILVPSIAMPILAMLYIVACSYGTTYAIPSTVIIKLFLMWIFLSVPCCAAGSYLAARHAQRGRGELTESSDDIARGVDGFPCPVNEDPRPIPTAVSWYGKPRWLIPSGGLFIFASVFIELHYLFTTLWNYKMYFMYGYLLGVYTILVTVVSATSIIVVYLVLNAENWQWRWTAFGCGASTGVYVFLYSIYYFIAKTTMHGFVQTSFYFGFATLIAAHLGWMCGTIAHASSSVFVHTIFKNLKVE